MPKPLIIAKLGFKQKGQVKGLRDLCKYLQYRDGSVRRDAYLTAEQGAEVRYPAGLSDYVTPRHRDAKWVDRGMGETYHQIANQAFAWQGRYNLARTWIISPDPELMKFVPEDKRFEVLRNVTEQTLERWHSDNGWGQPAYSYVIHDKQRSTDGEQMVHAHVITPATIPVDEAGALGRVDHIVRKAHIRDLHRTVGQTFEEELGRVLGKERAQEIIAERNAPIEHEQHPSKDQRERLKKLKTLADVMQLLKAEKAARRAKKDQKKDRRRKHQRQAELRMYARYVGEKREKRREADYLRVKATRQQAQDGELDRERAHHRARISQIKERGQRIPTHAEALEHEENRRAMLRIYYAGLFIQQDAERDQDRIVERIPDQGVEL